MLTPVQVWHLSHLNCTFAKHPGLSTCYQQTLQRLPWIHSALCLLLVTNSWCFTCPLLKSNKAKWNSDSWVTHKQASAHCRGGVLFNVVWSPPGYLAWSSRITDPFGFSFLPSHLRAAGAGEGKTVLSKPFLCEGSPQPHELWQKQLQSQWCSLSKAEGKLLRKDTAPTHFYCQKAAGRRWEPKCFNLQDWFN